MEPHARYAIVGLVVVAIVVGITASAVWLLQPGAEEGMDRYSIYFRNQSLSGLQIDSVVTMRGISIGNVRNIQILPEDIERVKVIIRIQGGTPIKVDAKAVILRNLLTGLAWIDLSGSTQGAPLLSKTDPLEPYPVIPEGQATFEQIQNTVPALLDRGGELVDRANALLSDKNQKNFSLLLGNLNDASAETRILLRQLRELSTSLTKAVESFDRRSERITEGLGKAGSTLLQRVSDISKNFETLARSLSQAAERIQDPKSALLGPPPAALGPGEKRR